MQAGPSKLAILRRHATIRRQLVLNSEIAGGFLVESVLLAIVNLLTYRPDSSRREMSDGAEERRTKRARGPFVAASAKAIPLRAPRD